MPNCFACSLYFLSLWMYSKLYSSATSLCLSLGEKDAAINIIAGMDEVGVSAPEELVTDVLRLTNKEEKLEKL